MPDRLYHPWRVLANDWPHVVVEHRADLAEGRLGETDSKSLIRMRSPLLQAERRCTLAHELIHLERQDDGECTPTLERDIDQEAARRLIAFDDLAAAIAWSDDIEEVADELWVTPQIARARLDCLWPREVAILAELVADLRA